MSSLDSYLSAARALHERAIVVDSHCDTTQKLLQPEWDFAARHSDGHADIPRLREGGVGGVVLAVYAPGPLPAGEGPRLARMQLQAIHRAVEWNPNHLLFARTAQDVGLARTQRKIAMLIGIEGGYLLDDSLNVLWEFQRRGAIYLTLTHAFHTSWADSSGVHENLAPLHGGLTSFGREVIRELNRLGMMVDVSHVSDATFWDVVETSRAPIIASHSSCRQLSPHRRNLSDEMMLAIAGAGGVVQINFASAFIDPTFPPMDPKTLEYWSTRGGFAASPYAAHTTPLSILADHFDHAIELLGSDHVGIGSDFDGVSAVPTGMEDYSKLPYLTAELIRRGHREEELCKVLGANFLRVMEQCQVGCGIENSRITSQPRLILASASPRRAQLLQGSGLRFDVVPSPDHEPSAPPSHSDPARWAEEVSLGKARSVAKTKPNGLILAGDTIAVLGDRIIGKPADRSDAERIIRRLAGTTHQVITALALLDLQSGQILLRHDITQVHMRALTDREIKEYLDTGEWEGKAGAYGIQDHGDKFVERIEGSFTNVVGLPVELLQQMLRYWTNQ